MWSEENRLWGGEKMSEQKSSKKRILMYVLAVIAVAAIAWIIFKGTNVFNYAENYDNAIEAQQAEDE